jgi:hypothetical protein
MSVSSVGSVNIIPPAPCAGKAADGDSSAAEAAESAAIKQAERSNGGFAPKAPSTQGRTDRQA